MEGISYISDCDDSTNCNTCTDASAGSCTACNSGYWLNSGACTGSYSFHIYGWDGFSGRTNTLMHCNIL